MLKESSNEILGLTEKEVEKYVYKIDLILKFTQKRERIW